MLMICTSTRLSLRSISSHLFTSATNWRWKAETSGFKSTNCAKPVRVSGFDIKIPRIPSRYDRWWHYLIPPVQPHNCRQLQEEDTPRRTLLVKQQIEVANGEPGSGTLPLTWRASPSRPRSWATNHSKKEKLNNSAKHPHKGVETYFRKETSVISMSMMPFSQWEGSLNTACDVCKCRNWNDSQHR